jgi:hypothetical protein
MRELEGRSYAEIAQILDVSVGAVETLIFRARRALREQLEGGLTCQEAEVTLSRLDEKRLSSSERGALRAHLRECKDCAVLERRQRAQRAALKNLGAIPLPASLGSFFGSGAAGGGVAVAGMGIGAKVATVLAAGLVATGIGREAINAVAAQEKATTTTPSLAVGTNFSALALLTGRSTSPFAEVLAATPLSKARGGPVSRSHSSKTRPREEGETQDSTAGTATAPPAAVQNVVAAVPRVPVPPVQIPQVPQLPIELPPPPPLPPVPQLPIPPPPPLP